MGNIGNNIRRVRKEHGISQKELADKIGVSQSAVNQWEVGKRIPKVQTIFRLSKAIPCAPKELMSEFDVEIDALYTMGDIFSEIRKKMEENKQEEIEAREKGDYLEADRKSTRLNSSHQD